MGLRFYSNAPATTLASSCTNVATTVVVSSTTGLPISYPYTIIVDRGLSTEEVMSVTNAAGTTLTVTRGYDSTTGFAHSSGASVLHGFSAIDPREANAHVNASTAVHGIAGAVVGNSDAQTLTNKTVALGSNTVSGTKAQFNTACTDADFATLDGTETLTNKTITSPKINQINDTSSGGKVMGFLTDASAVNQFDVRAAPTGFPSIISAVGSDTNIGINLIPKGTGVVYANGVAMTTASNTQTLTNKTLTSPTINTPTVITLTLDGVNISGVWSAWSPTLTNITVGNGTLVTRYMQIGKTIHFKVVLTWGSTTSFAGIPQFTFPVTPESTSVITNTTIGAGLAYDSSAGASGYFGLETLLTSATQFSGLTTSIGGASRVNATIPFTWATGDILSLEGTYEAA